MGKSVLSMQLAQALTTRTKFLDREVQGGPWKVLYVQADMPPQEWIQQLKMFQATTGPTWDTIPLPPPSPLLNPATFEEVKKVAANYNFIILDAWISLFNAELKNLQLQHYVSLLRQLHPGPIWIIHHKRKSPPGIPDDNPIAGGFALAAGVSAIYDLNKTRLHAKGRTVRAEIGLRRLPSGLWAVDPSYSAP